jgi:hypothetical protein
MGRKLIVELSTLEDFAFDFSSCHHIARFNLKSRDDAIKVAVHLMANNKALNWHAPDDDEQMFSWVSFEWEDGTPITVHIDTDMSPAIELGMIFTPEGDDKLDGAKWICNTPSLDDILHYAAVVREALSISN